MTRRALVAAAIALLCGFACYPLRALLPIAIRGFLPDFLWAFAFACVLSVVTRRARWLASGLVLAELLELAQLHSAAPGTFDVADCIAILVGFGLGAAVAQSGRRGANARASSISSVCGAAR